MSYADLEQFRLYYEEHGTGTPVVFLHGFTLDRRMWYGQAEHLKGGFRVLLPDARGHGLSDAPSTGYSRADRVADLLSFADTLGLDRFHLVGLSMGGSTGIGFALAHPQRLLSLTLVSTGAAGYEVSKKISHLDQIARKDGIEAAMDKWKEMSLLWYREDRQEIRWLMETMINDYSGAVWLDPMRGRYPREYDLDQVNAITLPTRLIVGALDDVFVTLARQLQARIAGSSLSIYENVGHMVNLEAPERFNAEVEAFLQSAASGG